MRARQGAMLGNTGCAEIPGTMYESWIGTGCSRCTSIGVLSSGQASFVGRHSGSAIPQ